MKGTTLLYAGQEVCATHKPSLFEREPIDWNSGRDISALLRKLAELKRRLPTDAVFQIDTDDAQGIVCAGYRAPNACAVGVFPLAGNAGVMPVPLADGSYTDALHDAPLFVQDGKVSVSEPVIIIL